MQVEPDVSKNAATIESILSQLVGLRIFKSWNIYLTRMFYFTDPLLESHDDDGKFRLTLECPWRIEHGGRVIVGSEDYGVRATDNSDPAWNRSEAQWGHLQDQKLLELLGESRNGAIYNTKLELLVTSVKADIFGGFQLSFLAGYALSAFPASCSEMEWLLSPRTGDPPAVPPPYL